MAKPLVSRLQGIWLLILGLIVTAIGAFFAYYGAKLIGLGGSPYFLVSGLVLLISGVLLWRKNVFGAYLYGAVLLGTVIWALWDVGLDFWPLVSRLLTLTGIAILVALSLPLLRNPAGKRLLGVLLGFLLAYWRWPSLPPSPGCSFPMRRCLLPVLNFRLYLLSPVKNSKTGVITVTLLVRRVLSRWIRSRVIT